MRFKYLTAIALALFCAAGAIAQSATKMENGIWKAGIVVSQLDVESAGIDAYFAAEPISENVAARMRGKSLPDGATVRLSDLRYLRMLHYDENGEMRTGEMVVNKAIANDVVAVFKELWQARYVIGSMRLIDDFNAEDTVSMCANNTSCFCYRAIVGGKKLSKHARGMAIDLNPLYNPYVKTVKCKRIVEPPCATPYVDRRRAFPQKINRNDIAFKVFTAHGFKWGGDWRTLKDYQHFEK